MEGIWDEKGKRNFREGLGRVEEEGTIEEEWKRMKDKIKEVVRKVQEERGSDKKKK